MKYLFFISFLKVKEKSLPTEEDLKKMIASSTIEEAMEILRNSSYAEIKPNQFEEDIEQIKEVDRKELKKLKLNSEVIRLIFLKEDFINLAFIIKKRLFNFEIPIDKKKEKELIEEYPSLIKNDFKKPTEVDNFLADCYLKELKRRAKKLKAKKLVKFLKEYEVKKDNKKLKKLEKEFIKEAEKQIAGISPIFAFFLRKRLIEKELRNIIGGKRLGLKKEEIKNKRRLLKAVAFN